MEIMYFVDYKRHNASSNAWAYKTELGTINLDEAKKKYHALLAEYVDSDSFDFVCVSLTDMFGNVLKSEYWEKAKVDMKQKAIADAIANYKANPTDENLAKIKERSKSRDERLKEIREDKAAEKIQRNWSKHKDKKDKKHKDRSKSKEERLKEIKENNSAKKIQRNWSKHKDKKDKKHKDRSISKEERLKEK